MNTTSSPLVQRRRLRTELRRARSGASLTQPQVAQAMDWSLSKIIRIETGAVGVSTNDLRALLNLYNIHDPHRTNELIELAKASRLQSWWSKYREVISPQYFQLIGYVEAASVLRTYEPLLVPGLLQTVGYAQTIMQEHADIDTPADLIQTRIEIRLARQKLLEQPSAPTMIFVFDEAVVRRLIGEQDIVKDQINRLIELASRPNITIEIIPFSAGLHRGMLESFVIAEFSDPEDSDVLYRETSRETIISHEEAEEISGYREVFEDLRRISLGADGSLAFLANIRAGDILIEGR